MDASRTAVIAILSHRLERSESLIGNVGDEFRGVLDRLIAATEDRDQAITELAREVRHRYYDEPVIEAPARRATRRWRSTCARSVRIRDARTARSVRALWWRARSRSRRAGSLAASGRRRQGSGGC